MDQNQARQRIFDRAFEEFVENEKPFSMDADGDCMYRADGTPGCVTRCVIGLFVPDEFYDPGMEGKDAPEAVGYLIDETGMAESDAPELFSAGCDFLCAMQKHLHDDLCEGRKDDFNLEAERRREAYACFAEGYGLEMP